MSALNLIPLKEIKIDLADSHKFTVTVKVIRVWTSTNGEKIPIGFEAIFVDAEGTVIHAVSSKRMVKFLSSKLCEGDTVRVSKFEVEESTLGKFQKGRVNHPARIVMIYGTQVNKCRPDVAILTNGIKLVPFPDIDGSIPGFYVDVIGQIISRGEVTYIDKQKANVVVVELRDDRNVTMKAVLWSAYADRIIKIYPVAGAVNDGIVVLLQFALRASFQGDVRVQTAVHATKMYINEDMPEFVEFKIRKKDNEGTSVTYLTSDYRSLKPEEWLNMESHRSPKQINDATAVGSYLLFVNFLKVDETAPWFYMSCSRCGTNARKANVGDICSGAKCAGQPLTLLIPKFRVKFIAKGVKEEKMFVVVFDEILSRFIQKPCQKVYEEWKAENDEDMIPMDFCELLHRDFLIKIRITEYNLRGDKFKEFSVDAITEDVDILSQYVALTVGEAVSTPKVALSTSKGKDKVDDEQAENASNDSEGFLTPMKRASPTQSDDDNPGTLGTQKSTSRIGKNIKIEKI